DRLVRPHVVDAVQHTFHAPVSCGMSRACRKCLRAIQTRCARHFSATKPQTLVNELAKKNPPRGSAAVHPVIKRCYFFSPPAPPPTLAPPPPLPPAGVAVPAACLLPPDTE